MFMKIFGKIKKLSVSSKDEGAGQIITEFVFLASKMYSYLKDNGVNYKITKGIKNCDQTIP